jgi:DNA-binding Lrp family transcriptional regulator
MLIFERELNIDKIDGEIIKLIQKKVDELRIPDDFVQDIAKRTSKSKEVIESRITKLRRMKMLETQIGMDLNESDIKIARIDLFVKKVNEIMLKFQNCRILTNLFRTTGDYNISIYMAAPNSSIIEKYIDSCLRPDKNIIKINTTFIIETAKKFIMPITFDMEMLESEACFKNCGDNLLLESIKNSRLLESVKKSL